MYYYTIYSNTPSYEIYSIDQMFCGGLKISVSLL